MIGEPFPYSFVGDSLVMSLFVLNILGIAYVLLMNGSSILERVKGMFYYRRQSQPYNDRTHIARICNVFLYWQTFFFCGVVALGYFRYSGLNVTGNAPYMMLAAYILLFATFFAIKEVAYDICNMVLFSKKVAAEWRQSYFFTIKMLGFLLLPVVLGLFFVKGLLYTIFLICIIFAILVCFFVIINRSIKIIFREKCNYLDIFLYLCALEILPMAILWKIIHALNNCLIIKI